MKRVVIKVIKQDARIDGTGDHLAPDVQPEAASVTTTVKKWIAESRRNKIESDRRSIEIITGWALE